MTAGKKSGENTRDGATDPAHEGDGRARKQRLAVPAQRFAHSSGR